MGKIKVKKIPIELEEFLKMVEENMRRNLGVPKDVNMRVGMTIQRRIPKFFEDNPEALKQLIYGNIKKRKKRK